MYRKLLTVCINGRPFTICYEHINDEGRADSPRLNDLIKSIRTEIVSVSEKGRANVEVVTEMPQLIVATLAFGSKCGGFVSKQGFLRRQFSKTDRLEGKLDNLESFLRQLAEYKNGCISEDIISDAKVTVSLE